MIRPYRVWAVTRKGRDRELHSQDQGAVDMTHPGTADARTPTRNPCAPQEVNRTMNKRFSFQLSRLIYSIAAALLLTAESASATADGPDFYQVTGVANGDVLNIRSHPNPHAEKLGEIPPDGTCLRNLGCQGGLTFQEFTELSKARQTARLKENPRWCRIEYQGVTGWVAGRYLQEGTCDSMATGRVPDLREPGSDSFQTVCGVIIDRKTHSYLCTVAEIKGNKGIERTALRFPDQRSSSSGARANRSMCSSKGSPAQRPRPIPPTRRD